MKGFLWGFGLIVVLGNTRCLGQIEAVIMSHKELTTGHRRQKHAVTFTHLAIFEGEASDSAGGFTVAHAEVDLSSGLLQHGGFFGGFNPLRGENTVEIVLPALADQTTDVGIFTKL